MGSIYTILSMVVVEFPILVENFALSTHPFQVEVDFPCPRTRIDSRFSENIVVMLFPLEAYR